jgi:hypothetical protein
MTKELQIRIDQPPELSVKDVLAQVEKIQGVMRQAMREDVHYGVIPGTEKPTLFKAGAEKLGLVFRFRPEFEIRRHDLERGHREYEVICRLIHFPTGQVVGEGLGSASTLESKYRYRRGEPDPTSAPVPPAYWNLRQTNPAKAQELLGGKDFLARKIDGAWTICRKASDRFENPDIADCYNTILKMAKKRALVDATLSATAASDCFTHEETEDEELEEAATVEEPKTETSSRQALGAALLERCDNDKSRVAALLKRYTGKDSLEQLTEEQARGALLFLKSGDGAAAGR